MNSHVVPQTPVLEETERGLHQGGARIGLKPAKKETITTRFQWKREAEERRRMEQGAETCRIYAELVRGAMRIGVALALSACSIADRIGPCPQERQSIDTVAVVNSASPKDTLALTMYNRRSCR